MAWSSSPTKVTLPRCARQQPHERELLRVGVLGLVDDDVAEALAQRETDRGPLLEQAHRLGDLVAVVDEGALRQEVLVDAEGSCQLRLRMRLVEEGRQRPPTRVRVRVLAEAGPGTGLQLRRRTRPGHPALRPSSLARAKSVHERAEEAGGVPERQEALQAELEEMVAQQDDGLRAADDPRVHGPSDGVTVLAQQPVAEGVEGVDGRVRLAVGHEEVHARLHLVRGALREGQGQDLRRARPAAGDEPGDASRDDLRLAGARARR